MQEENNVETWQVSTYARVTAERILERYQIRLSHGDLNQAIKNPKSTYYQFLQMPLKNVFNGILLQQAKDYQIALQKMFVDYFLSGEDEKDEAAPGANLRSQLRAEKESLIQLGKQFQEAEMTHYNLIADSQKRLIALARSWRDALLEQAKSMAAELSSSVSFDRIMDILNYLLMRETESFNQTHWSFVEDKLKQPLSAQARNSMHQKVTFLHQYMLEHKGELEPFYDEILATMKNLQSFYHSLKDMIAHIQTVMELLPRSPLESNHVEESED